MLSRDFIMQSRPHRIRHLRISAELGASRAGGRLEQFLNWLFRFGRHDSIS